MTDEVPNDGIQRVIAELLRGHPVVARWDDLEAVGTTSADWLHELRDVARRADVEVKSSELNTVRVTAVFNGADEPEMEIIQNLVNTLESARQVRAALAAARAESPDDEL